MNDVIFRQYDIRGKVGTEMPLEEIYNLTRAIAHYFIQKNPTTKTVAVGADGRTHSPFIKQEVCRALTDSGLNVIFIGTCPSPVLYFSLYKLPVDAGIMITASHNGKEYNGLKLCLLKESVWGEQIQEIKNIFRNQTNLVPVPGKGSYTEHSLIPEYIDWMIDQFAHLKKMEIKAIVDCGNGAAGTVLPMLVRRMEWPNVKLLFAEVDGNYPNHEADPTVEKNMLDVRNALKTNDYQIGIGLDGDCDRMAAMTKSGTLIQGDMLLALFAKKIIQDNSSSKIVFDVKCSSGLIELLNAWGATPIMSPSGHSIIKNQMKINNALLAGELSCHFFFSDRYFGYDDGIYSMLRLFELLKESKISLDEMITIFPKKWSTREIRIACSDEQKEKSIKAIQRELEKIDTIKLSLIDGIRATFEKGWAIIRASNTQPVICLRFEGNSPEDLEEIKGQFLRLLKPFFDESVLRNEMNQ